CGGGFDVVPGIASEGRLVSLTPGAHRITVCAEDRGAAYRGRYGFRTYSISTAPESRSDTITIGDTIATESIDVPGDVDEFFFYGKVGRHIDVPFQGLADSAGRAGGFYLQIDQVNTAVTLGAVGTPVFASTFSGQRTH